MCFVFSVSQVSENVFLCMQIVYLLELKWLLNLESTSESRCAVSD